MYYRMETDNMQLTTYIEQESGPAIFKLTMGRLYTPKEGALPFRFTCRDPDGNQPLDYVDGNSLMSRRLVAALEVAGVDNLQKFEAELKDQTSGDVNRDFYVVNIIGLVAAADMTNSEALPLGEGQVFTSLKVAPGKPRDLLMFRLAESLVDVIVHEKVAAAIEKGGFRGVLLSPVSDH